MHPTLQQRVLQLGGNPTSGLTGIAASEGDKLLPVSTVQLGRKPHQPSINSAPIVLPDSASLPQPIPAYRRHAHARPGL